MKQRIRNPVIPDYTPRDDRKLEKELVLNFSSCCVCGGKIGYGYYGRWGDSGTCSGKCEREMQSRPRDYGEPK